MHSFTTTVCAILTDLRATIARIAPRERARTLFLNLLWGRLSHNAQLFDLFERLLAEWRNGTLPGAGTLCPPPSAVPAATRASKGSRIGQNMAVPGWTGAGRLHRSSLEFAPLPP